ncbi:MAG: alginate lyase family protein, partial [Pyrinomonadaceae bacterium]
MYHADIALLRGDGSDVRVLWELNRLGHLITLSRAYGVTKDERFAADFFSQVRSWRKQNMVGRGANWACAMEVALRAMNLLAAFALFRHSSQLTEETLAETLALFDQHGAHIFRNLEFSYISTSNHYLSDVVGLLWLGLMLPELEAAQEWRAFGWREMLCEMDKQILSDGADFESSTGYHRFILELLLYSFLLCRENKIEIEEKYWRKLRAMLEYVCAYLRPDGRAPRIGDTDGGRALPLTQRDADDHAYLLALGASVFQEARFRQTARGLPEELLWLLGERGVREFENLEADEENAASQSFKDAGTYVLREGDLYLLFNASGNGLNGRGSHAHNDALSIEVSACGRAFLVDPGTYVYTSNLHERHLFRSTAYHSTVLIDGAEQNETQEQMPFVIGDEAHPRVLDWETTPEYDRVAAEHDGYRRLTQPVTHRRAVRFDKRERFWL